MVIGELVQVTSSCVIINAMKVQDLSSNELSPKAWNMEVKDYWLHAP